MTIPDSHIDLLEKPAYWHVATLGPSGEPQTTPVWAGWDGENLLFSQTRTRQKARNIEANPAIAVSATDPDNAYRYLEIRGRVVRVDEDSNNDFINSMAKKYMGVDEYPWHQPGDERIVMVVQPEHTTYM